MRGYASIFALVGSYLVCAAVPLSALDVSNRYRSPRNPERGIRASTELIVLHTTEAPARSSLNKVSERGECHYCVTEDGTVYRIVDRDRLAYHAGRSMWNGKEDVDKFSVGIECVGYHDKPMPAVQLLAIRDLVKELRRLYRVTDDRVVCHSHVAYGAPNRWHKKRHRGRKQCGMLFAMASVRKILELKSRPKVDPDQRSRRLVQADPYLQKVLYGSVDTMKGRVSGSVQAEPPKKSFMDWIRPTAPKTTPPAPVSGRSRPVAVVKTTPPASVAELKARGYRMLGTVGKNRSASAIAGAAWNGKNTFYTIRDKVMPGDKINPKRIEVGTVIWTK